MKLVTIIGARPQFIKAAMVSRAIREYNSQLTTHDSQIDEVIVHTGQHYDYKMSQVFFDQLEMPKPHYHLDIGSSTHGDQTGRMLTAIEKVLIDEKPDAVLVYGDTNSTMAGSLAAAKLHIPVGHVEGGMRSFNRRMPEEINRVLTDHVAKWHFCATETAVKNLKHEGITEGFHLVGDVMHDAILSYKDIAADKSDILQRLGLLGCHSEAQPKNPDGNPSRLTTHHSPLTKYVLATVHRAENTDDPDRLRNIFEALAEISKDMPVVLPLHPRTRKAIENISVKGQRLKVNGSSEEPLTLNRSPLTGSVKIIDPVPYLDMLQLEAHASIILTDSGGMQKEAFWLGVPCVTMRDETEWVETVESGRNKVVGAGSASIVRAVGEYLDVDETVGADRDNIGISSAADRVVECISGGE